MSSAKFVPKTFSKNFFFISGNFFREFSPDKFFPAIFLENLFFNNFFSNDLTLHFTYFNSCVYICTYILLLESYQLYRLVFGNHILIRCAYVYACVFTSYY